MIDAITPALSAYMRECDEQAAYEAALDQAARDIFEAKIHAPHGNADIKMRYAGCHAADSSNSGRFSMAASLIKPASRKARLSRWLG